MKNHVFIAVMLCLTSLFLVHTKAFSQEMLRKITTDSFQRSTIVHNSTSNGNKVAIEKQTQDFMKSPKFKKVVLPLVFHIISRSGETAPDITQVQSQIDALNRDFDKKSYKSKHVADSIEKFAAKVTDPEIQFCLALQDPSGKATTGINYIQSTSTAWGMSQDIKLGNKGGVSPWNPTQYINVWVANLGSTTSGYAQMPGGPTETDGIVIDFQFFGMNGTTKAPYNQGKTLTHLIGNYLNLYDLWGPCYCCDDEVSDTPIHNAPNYGKTDEFKHVSLCLGNGVELSMNFMDNTDDDWMYMFTTGQKSRMQSILADNGYRSSLVNNNSACNKKSIELENRNALITNVSIYPNPTSGDFTIAIQSSKMEINLGIEAIDPIGRIVKEEKIKVKEGIYKSIWKTNGWPAGIYTIKIVGKNYRSEQKLVIF